MMDRFDAYLANRLKNTYNRRTPPATSRERLLRAARQSRYQPKQTFTTFLEGVFTRPNLLSHNQPVDIYTRMFNRMNVYSFQTGVVSLRLIV